MKTQNKSTDKKKSRTFSPFKSKMQAYHKSALQSLNSQMKKLYESKINMIFGNPSTELQINPTDKKPSQIHSMLKPKMQEHHKSRLQGLKEQMKKQYEGKINF